MNKVKKLTYKIAALIVVIILFSLCGGGAVGHAAVTYSEALEDLQKDEAFNPEKYPEIADDYSLQVIQIAESSDGELFVYVYQPSAGSKTLAATTIRLSTSIGENYSPKDYKINLLNRQGVFGKYIVDNFTVKKDTVRYYDIVAIAREWDENIDYGPTNGNTVNEVGYEVAKLFTACTVNGEVTYSETHSEVITVTDKRVGKLRYTDGFYLYGVNSCESHYVAFSTDKQIDKLYEADIEYMSQYIYRKGYEIALSHKVIITEDKSESEPHKVAKTLTYTDKASNAGNGIFGNKYTWNRIESVKDFISKENLTDEAKADLKDKQWVLRFAETAFNFSNLPNNHLREHTEISAVTILRLKFETAGIVYNLGVVDNKQTGSNVPDNPPDLPDIPVIPGITNKGGCTGINWQVIFFVLGVICVLAVLKVTGLLEWIIQGVLYVICLPFKALVGLFNRKDKSEQKEPKRKKNKKTGKKK